MPGSGSAGPPGGPPMPGARPAGGSSLEQKGGSSREGMLAVNDLVYVLNPDLSVSVNRTHKNHFFQSNTYKNSQRAICILNSGADYGDMRSSTLNFSITLDQPEWKTGGAAVPGDMSGYFGKNGSALNLIKHILITSRSGDELIRVNDLNHLAAACNGFKYSEEWMNTVGQGMGIGQGVYSTRVARFSIPLYALCDLFGYGRLMPAMILAGMRIEIDWEKPERAFLAIKSSGNDQTNTDANQYLPIPSYKIDNLYISLYSIQLTDGTQRALNEMSAVNGLEIVYCDHERTEQVVKTKMIHMEVRKSASRALKAFAAIRDSNPENDFKSDSFKTNEWDTVLYQWQLGSLYFPQQPVKNSDPYLMLPETYQQTLLAFGRYKPGEQKAAVPLYDTAHYLEQPTANLTGATNASGDRKGPDLTLVNPAATDANARTGAPAFVGGKDGTFCNGRTTISVLLERSDLFNLTGVPINNSRVLALRQELDPNADDKDRTVTIFLKYVRLARVFLNNVEVEQ